MHPIKNLIKNWPRIKWHLRMIYKTYIKEEHEFYKYRKTITITRNYESQYGTTEPIYQLKNELEDMFEEIASYQMMLGRPQLQTEQEYDRKVISYEFTCIKR